MLQAITDRMLQTCDVLTERLERRKWLLKHSQEPVFVSDQKIGRRDLAIASAIFDLVDGTPSVSAL